MVEVLPFKGIEYTTNDSKDVITEPYDKIPKELQLKYYERSPYNFIRLNLPMENDPYGSARVTLNEWLRKGILAKDQKPHFYEYVEEFTLFGSTRKRTGVFAAVKIEDYSEKEIYRHERTFTGPKEDRLKMLRATNTDLEPVFFLYDDPSMEVKELLDSLPKIKNLDVTDDGGVRHIVYSLDSHEITNLFKSKKLVIADGHHRYETALAFSKENNHVGNTGYVMAVLVNRHDPGLVILPSHRVITNSKLSPQQVLEKLKEKFEIREVPIESINDPLQMDMVFYFKGRGFDLKLRADVPKTTSLVEDINVSILNNFVISNVLEIRNREMIKFTRWAADAIGDVNDGNASFAFLVKPVDPKTVWNVAMNDEVMPEKSTDFYPKLISGLMIFDLLER